jgi:hypothetical protein
MYLKPLIVKQIFTLAQRTAQDKRVSYAWKPISVSGSVKILSLFCFFDDDRPGLEHVAVVGEFERDLGVLLGRQDGDALPVD